MVHNSCSKSVGGMKTREVSVYQNNHYSFTYIDIFSDTSDIFTREQSNTKATIDRIKQKIIYQDINLHPLFIQKNYKAKVHNTKISTLDIETYENSNKIFSPYAIG